VLSAALLLSAAGGVSASAQNNTGYPSGTKCGDLSGQRQAACHDAFDPRPNPREIINQPRPKNLIIPKAKLRGTSDPPTPPKSQKTVPAPLLPPGN